jgi:hypothetical protein
MPKLEHNPYEVSFSTSFGSNEQLGYDDVETSKSFMVEWHKKQYMGECYGGYVPIILCYEFKLQQGQESVSKMFARITKELKPEYMQTTEYKQLDQHSKDILIQATTRVCEYKSFSDLRLRTLTHDDTVHGREAWSHLHKALQLFCFVRTNTDGTEAVEVAEEWTWFTEPVLAKLREGLQSALHINVH